MECTTVDGDVRAINVRIKTKLCIKIKNLRDFAIAQVFHAQLSIVDSSLFHQNLPHFYPTLFIFKAIEVDA
jgi:hypothetical protein